MPSFNAYFACQAADETAVDAARRPMAVYNCVGSADLTGLRVRVA